MSDVLRLLHVLTASEDTMQPQLAEEPQSSPSVLPSGHTTAMGTGVTATPTNATVGTAGTATVVEEHVQVRHSLSNLS